MPWEREINEPSVAKEEYGGSGVKKVEQIVEQRLELVTTRLLCNLQYPVLY